MLRYFLLLLLISNTSFSKDNYYICSSVNNQDITDKVFERYKIPENKRNNYRIAYIIPLIFGRYDFFNNYWPEPNYLKNSNCYLEKKLLYSVKNNKISKDEAIKILLCSKLGHCFEEINKDYIK